VVVRVVVPVARGVALAVARVVVLVVARGVALEVVRVVVLVVALVVVAELERGAVARALGVVAEPELVAVRRVVAARERAAGLASAVVAVGQGLAEEERALPGVLE
jgi:hypothetical protein